jgi:DNA-binding transcriptional MerR regulator
MVFLTRNPWAPALSSAGALVMEVTRLNPVTCSTTRTTPPTPWARAAEIIGCAPDLLRRLGDAKLIDQFRSGGGHRRYSRYQIRFPARAREMRDQGTDMASAVPIIILEDQLQEALRTTTTTVTRNPVGLVTCRQCAPVPPSPGPMPWWWCREGCSRMWAAWAVTASIWPVARDAGADDAGPRRAGRVRPRRPGCRAHRAAGRAPHRRPHRDPRAR